MQSTIDQSSGRERDQRVRFKHPVRVVPIGGPPRAYRVLAGNLSRQGMFLKMPTPFDTGTKVALSLEAGGRVLPFAQAEVVWRDVTELKDPGRGAGFGVRFTGFLHPRAHELVDYLVSNLETGKPLVSPGKTALWPRRLGWIAAGLIAVVVGAAITFGVLAVVRRPAEPVAVAPARAMAAPAPVVQLEAVRSVELRPSVELAAGSEETTAAEYPVVTADDLAAMPRSEADPSRASSAPDDSAPNDDAAEPSSAEENVRPAKAAADKVAEKVSADATDKLAADVVAAERLAADRLAADKVATDKVAADKVAADKVAADKVAADKVTADKVTADKVTADKVTADKVTADKVSVKATARPVEVPQKSPLQKVSTESVTTKSSLALPSGAVRSVVARVSGNQLSLSLSLAPGAAITRAFTLHNPDRLAIDVSGATPNKSHTLSGSGEIRTVRIGKLPRGTRIVLDLLRAPGAPQASGESVTVPLR